MHKRSDSRRSAVEAAPAASNAQVDQRSTRKLEVDDDLTVAIRLTLQQAGCSSVTRANNGIEALERIENDRFDLVLLNCRMPRMNAAAALRILRYRGNDTPVIMIPAWDRDHIPEPLDGLAPDEFVEKPVSDAFVVSRIEQVLVTHYARGGGPSPNCLSTGARNEVLHVQDGHDDLRRRARSSDRCVEE